MGEKPQGGHFVPPADWIGLNRSFILKKWQKPQKLRNYDVKIFGILAKFTIRQDRSPSHHTSHFGPKIAKVHFVGNFTIFPIYPYPVTNSTSLMDGPAPPPLHTTLKTAPWDIP